jgi:hypothetical protein
MLLPKSGDACKHRSVTIINREDLPSYSCERFYLLSELQQRAHSSVFLSDQEDNSTQGTTSTAPDDDSDLVGENLGQFALLYLFWKPDMTEDTTEFIEQHILPQVQQLQTMRTVVNSMPSLDRPSISGVIHRRENEDSQVEVDHPDDAKDEEGEATISIYIVVDRLCACDLVDASDPLESTRKMEQQYRNEEVKIEDLAKKVAVHEQLRDLCEGITVGLSNHERCAPGLEACSDAVAWGAKERRTALASMKTEDDGRSALGIVANEPNDLLGLQSESTTDAAQGVMQMRLSTEWNGQGNLKSFAERAQSFWRQQRGLVDTQKLTCRRIISRKRRIPARINPGEMNDFLINGLALLFIFGYLFFHLWSDLQDLIYYFDPSAWDNFIQRLRSF